MSQLHSETIRRAKEVSKGQSIAPPEALQLVRALKKERAFGYARKLLAEARKDPQVLNDPPLRRKFAQEHALCTYKDPDLQPDQKLDQALMILQVEDNPTTSVDQETLGLAGSIYKQKWQRDAQRQHLIRSLAYYYKGYRQKVEGDYGYTGINAAFVLDVLAQQEALEASQAGTDSGIAEMRQEEAKRIREDIVSVLPGLVDVPANKWLSTTWWFLVTVGEAYFGLERYNEALTWLKKATALPDVADWEREATARQLAWLAQLKHNGSTTTEDSQAWKVLQEFLGHNFAAARSVLTGKVGLALSGGGFRAALFHIGVLAKLAELDMLRHVEVLSCVSGGAIIGAHYYLEVRQLMHTKTDREMTRDDYVAIVQRIERDFLAGVQRNIRTRVAAEWTTNLKMLLLPNYSRTMRAGELYEREIFAKVDHGGKDKVRWLNELKIQPKGETAPFLPKDHNWRRNAKVPILILNATTLNTGHNWQFTATWMGEPPSGVDSEVDGNDRLRRMYYEDAPSQHRKVRLGHAVAASACVPGLFEPLALAKLYPNKVVRLVDGGVHDNQGIVGLLDQAALCCWSATRAGKWIRRIIPATVS